MNKNILKSTLNEHSKMVPKINIIDTQHKIIINELMFESFINYGEAEEKVLEDGHSYEDDFKYFMKFYYDFQAKSYYYRFTIFYPEQVFTIDDEKLILHFKIKKIGKEYIFNIIKSDNYEHEDFVKRDLGWRKNLKDVIEKCDITYDDIYSETVYILKEYQKRFYEDYSKRKEIL